MKTCIHTVIYKKYICTYNIIIFSVTSQWCNKKEKRKRKTINGEAHVGPNSPTFAAIDRRSNGSHRVSLVYNASSNPNPNPIPLLPQSLLPPHPSPSLDPPPLLPLSPADFTPYSRFLLLPPKPAFDSSGPESPPDSPRWRARALWRWRGRTTSTGAAATGRRWSSTPRRWRRRGAPRSASRCVAPLGDSPHEIQPPSESRRRGQGRPDPPH
jgi:hypothetical protein